MSRRVHPSPNPCTSCTTCNCRWNRADGVQGADVPGGVGRVGSPLVLPSIITRPSCAARPSDGYLFSVLILSKKKGRLAGEGEGGGTAGYTPLQTRAPTARSPLARLDRSESHLGSRPSQQNRLRRAAKRFTREGGAHGAVVWEGGGGSGTPPVFVFREHRESGRVVVSLSSRQSLRDWLVERVHDEKELRALRQSRDYGPAQWLECR